MNSRTEQVKVLWQEIDEHLLNDSQPSDYLRSLESHPLFVASPYNMLLRMKSTEQSTAHHPEGNVWNHTLMVVDMAAKVRRRSKDPKVFMYAALLHDIGKPDATQIRNGKITAYDHDKKGALLAKIFLEAIIDNQKLISRTVNMVRCHMQPTFIVRKMRFADQKLVRKSVDIEELALLGFCDRTGRGDADEFREKVNMERFLELIR